MKTKLGSITGISLVTMLLLSIFMLPIMAGDPLVPHVGNVMWIESDDPRDLDPDPQVIKFETGDIKPGEEFTITVWLNMEVDVFAWQFMLTFCSDLVQCTGAGSTSPPTSEYMKGHTTTYTGPIINNVDDYVKAGETCLGTDFVPGPHHGSLCWMTFILIDTPEKGECLTCAFRLSDTYPTDTWVWDPFLTQVLEEVEDCPISYNWTPPETYPHCAVHNPGPPRCPLAGNCTTNFFGDRGTNWTCTDFDVDIYICNLDPAWGLTNATIWLNYDTDIIDPMGGVANVTVHPPWTTLWLAVVHMDPLDQIEIVVEYPCGLPPEYIKDFPKNDSVLVATVRFHIKTQPLYPDQVHSDLIFCKCILWNHEYQIETTEPQNGFVKIEGYLLMELPWLEVIDPTDGDHEIVMGPEPCICKTFDVDVWIKNLDVRWKAVAFEFKLGYTEDTSVDPLYIECADPTCKCVEGDWLRSFPTPPNTPDNCTFVICIDNHDPPEPPAHVKFGILLLPRLSDGKWTVFPEGDGILVTFTFHVVFQSYPINVTAPLGLYDILFVDEEGNDIPVDLDKCKNGTVHIVTALPGREIDLYTQYPDGFNGKGPHMPSDMFWPQKIVYLYAKVTYNYWPVNNKDVGFEVEGPFDQETGEPLPRYQIWVKASARTNKDGIAWIKFQLPWPCNDPEGLFGKWKVTATVDICCTVVNDTLKFDYNYMVVWKDVVLDRQEEPEYNHCETVEILVKFKSKSQQKRWVLIAVVLEDELQTPVGIALVGLYIGGAKPCHYVQYEVTVRIHVPQHAFAGVGHLLVNAFTKDPTIGGVPWCPQFAPLPEVWIQPY